MATPYMSLTLPTVSTTAGPQWATLINAALTLLDSHDHAPGFGRQVRTAGLNIDADLSFGDKNATAMRSVRFQNQAAPLSLLSDVGCIYESGGNLYYNSSAGAQVQITSGAGLNAASIGGIGGDYVTSGASVFYTAASTTFSFWQAANKSANLDAGKLTIREPGVTSANGITLQSPTGLAAAYNLTLPTALPAATKILTLGNTGTIAAVYDVDGATLEVASNALRVKDLGISTAKIADAAVTRPKQAAVGQQISSSCGTFATSSTTYVDVTSLSVSFTTTGRPVVLCLHPDGTSPSSVLTPGDPALIQLAVLRGAAILGEWKLSTVSGGTGLHQSPSLVFLDAPAAGTYTWKVQAKIVGSGTGGVNAFRLVAYEL